MSLDRATLASPASGAPDPEMEAVLRDGIDGLSALFRTLGHEGRLRILCLLAAGEQSVGVLEDLLGQRQTAVSQQLARLRREGMVMTRREGRTIHYTLASERLRRILQLLPLIAARD